MLFFDTCQVIISTFSISVNIDLSKKMSSIIEWNRTEKDELQCSETYDIKAAQILPYLLDMEPRQIEKGIKPSKLLKALQLSTEERLEKMRSPLRKYKVGSRRKTFSVYPEAIIFQNFNVGTAYHTTLTIINQKNTCTNLNVYFDTSRFFTLNMDTEYCNLTKLAPGMTSVFHVTFLPTDSYRDYSHVINFQSKDEEFSVPIFALGPRALVDIPDKIVLPATLVKLESSQIIIIRNRGLVPLNYSQTVTVPFSSNIPKALVPPDGIVEVKFSCYSLKPGRQLGQIRTCIRNEIIMITEIECDVTRAEVNLDSHSVSFDDVYMGLYSSKILTLHNSHDYPLHFAWKMIDSDEEKVEMSKLVDLMSEMKRYEQERCEKLKYLDIIDGEGHKFVYERIFEDEKEQLSRKDTYLYKSDFFQIIPKVGRVLPQSDFEFSVIFAPRRNIFYQSSACLDIEGNERRVRVSFYGFGIGPPVLLTVKTLNAGKIYLTDKHQYELAVVNKGVIPATVTFHSKKTDWGGFLDCNPTSLTLGPNSTQAFVVIFHSEQQGEFVETLDFEVEESQEHLQCVFTGNVICPLLKCVPEALDFGTVSVGVDVDKVIQLVNDSRVSIQFEFVFEDHFKPTAEKYMQIIPRYGRVQSDSRTTVKISFSSDITLKWQTKLLLVMWNSRKYSIDIPLVGECTCPRISCDPALIAIKFCFLNCSYNRTVQLTNQTDVPGHVEYVEEEQSEDKSISCVPSKTRIHFRPHTTVKLDLTIKVTSLGHHELPIRFAIIGGAIQTLCEVKCNGQGPVVSYYPDEVNFGTMEVLQTYQEKLTLVNDSPIPAKIHVYCKSGGPFFVAENDNVVELDPEEESSVTVCAKFNNPGKRQGTILVNIEQGDVCSIRVFGEGEGTSILSEPPLAPVLNLGTVLTYNTFEREVKLTNKGNILHKLLFTKRAVVRNIREEDEEKQTGSVSIFPHYMEMKPDEEKIVLVKCCTKTPKKVSEQFFCHALIGKSVQVQNIIAFFVELEFVDPMLTFSQRNVKFNLEISGHVVEGKTEDVIQVNNITGIPLNVTITMEENSGDFTIIDSGENASRVAQNILQEEKVRVGFRPKIREKRKNSRNARLKFEYENHPKTDVINLNGQLMFPTVKLYPNNVDFHCVPLCSTSQKNIIIQNVSDMTVHFKWLWIKKSVLITELQPVKEMRKGLKICSDSFTTNVFMDYVELRGHHDDANKFNSATEEIVPSNLIYEGEKYMRKMKLKLSQALFSYDAPKETDGKLLLREHAINLPINKLFSIEPSEGTLNPYEYSIISIGFSPPPNTEIQATAVCHVEGGEEELLTVTGISSKLSYKLDKCGVNYGNQVFCEVCTDNLTLINDGLCNIDFRVTVKESVRMQPKMLVVSPKEGNVSPNASQTFKIDYFPGVPGCFDQSFVLELGYLEPVAVKVHGYAVLSQVYLYVPRPDLELDLVDCYKAIAWLTPEYLELTQKKFNDIIEPDNGSYLEKNDWIYISYNELYPTLVDIDMAIERIAAFNHIDKNPRTLRDHTITKKVPHIPQFFPAPYCVDFGYVIRDVPVCYTILIYNYGPTAAEVKLLEDNKTALLEKELKIEFKPKVLAPAETLDLYVIFAPTKRKCLVLDKEIGGTFRMAVKHGPIITVQVKGKVTLPIVSLEHKEIIFEEVYCGDVLRKNVILTNNGNVQSKWSATINKPTIKQEAGCFFLMPSAGQLDPGKKQYLNIYFVPACIKRVRRTLRIDVESNSEPVLMDLIGEGKETNLMIIPNELKFSPTLNYSNQVLYFAVQNMSEIPIEIYFPTFDNDCEFERNLIQIYLRYKNLKNVFVPLRTADSRLPDCFLNTYSTLVTRLQQRMMASRNGREENDVETKSCPKESSGSVHADPLAKYSPEEIYSLLMEYIKAEGFQSAAEDTDTYAYHPDDSCDRIEIVETSNKSTSQSEEIDFKAVLLVFHGALTTDYYAAANQAGIELSIPVYSIDRLIIESIVENTHPTAQDILENINKEVLNFLDAKSDALLLENLDEDDSPFDSLLNRVIVITTRKPKKGAKQRSPDKGKGSKGSSERSQSKSKQDKQNENFLNISSDSLVELLKPKMKKHVQLIIESLHSVFIPKANVALYTILKAAGPVEYINLVILSFTVSDYVKNEESKIIPSNGNKSAEEDVRPVSSPKKKNVLDKASRLSAKEGSEKKSKTSHLTTKTIDTHKKILQGLNKAMKLELEEFESLRNEIVHVVQYWDKRSAVLRKPFSASNSPKGTPGAKDSSKVSRNLLKKLGSGSNIEEPFEPGLHLWLLRNSAHNRGVDFPQMVRNSLKNDAELRAILTEIVDEEQPKFVESETIFSIISKPCARKIQRSSVFTIRNFQEKVENVDNLQSRSRSNSSTKIKRKRMSKNSKKNADTKSSANDLSMNATKPEPHNDLTTRTVLMPGDSVKYQVLFCPQKCGFYNYTFTIETNKTKVPYNIVCSAICEYPSLDLSPEVVFPRTLENYREKASYDHFVFIKDQQIFDFGSIIAGINVDKCPVYATAILLRNASSSICEVTISLSNDVFTVEPTSLEINPKSENHVKISVKSIKIGTLISQLYISTKNNPKVERFTLACSPCKLEFSVYPKVVNFDKVPVNFTAKRVVKLTNTSPINLRWEYADSGSISEIIDLSQDSGYISLYSISELVFKFNPAEEMSFPKRYLTIKVFDVNSSSTEPCFTETIMLHADSVEYDMDVLDHIQYGEIKGGVDHRSNFTITNKAKCEVALKIETISNPLEKCNFVRDYFKIQPLFLTIGSQKTENLSISFHPKSNFNISNLLIFVVNMVESVQSGHVVKTYKVSCSANSVMPSYKICPLSRVSFGYVPLSTAKKLTMEILNNGKFSFSFHLLNYAKYIEAHKKGTHEKKASAIENSPKQEKKQKTEDKASEKGSHKTDKNNNKDTKTKSETSKASKATKSKTEKKKPSKLTKLDVGGFSIVPSTGTVEPNEKCVITIEITPNEAREYREEILLNVEEIEDVHKKKVITLEAFGCEPRIDLKDFDGIFMEHYKVANIEEFILPKNIDGCSVFSWNETALYFKLVCLQKAFATKLYFKNVGHVTSHLTAKIDDFGKHAFTITPSAITLEAHSKKSMELTFKPNSLELVPAVLELSYDASTDNKVLIHLYGEACLPQIKLLEPLGVTDDTFLNLGLICVGSPRMKRITFQNIGPIKCKVILELSSTNDALSIVPCEDTLRKLNVQPQNDDMKHNTMVKLFLQETAEFDIIYKPIKEEDIQVLLSLHTVGNPYELIKIHLEAKSYDSEIVFEDLEPVEIKPSQSSLTSRSSIGYDLNLGYRELNKLFTKLFTIRNRSKSDIFKFRFYFHSVIFIPQVGHLKPGSSKKILVVFQAESPVSIEKREIACNITKIQYIYPNEDLLSWDDRQKFMYSTSDLEVSMSSNENLKSASLSDKNNDRSSLSLRSEIENKLTKSKIITEGMEPEIVTLPDSIKIIPLYLSVSADYASYKCELDLIEFEDTYVHEKTRQEFTVENDGTVPIFVVWSVTDRNISNSQKSKSETNLTHCLTFRDESLKSASSSSIASSQHFTVHGHESLPITIDPQESIIDPGKSKTFDIHFQPIEEGDVEVVLKSNIPALSPDLEQIGVAVNARALPIPFYFELEDGSSTSQNVTVHFENVGVANETVRKILLVNPGDERISFTITSQDVKEFSYFVCEVPQGMISKKKKCFTSFSFRPPIFGTFKERYQLNIPEMNLLKEVMLQGICREPRVYFEETSVSLKPTVPKIKSTKCIKLKNDETFPISFKFIKKSLYSETQQDKLEVYPMIGKLKAQSEIDIKVTFVALNIVSTTFHLKCMVEKLKSPLSLHITVSCIKIEPSVTFISKNGEIITLQEDQTNIIDLGSTCPGRRELIPFTITNQGSTGMFYAWDFDSKPIGHLFRISVDREKEFINSHNAVTTHLSIVPTRTGALKEFKLNLNILYGPTYNICMNAISDKPNFVFSFNEYDFGYCLIQNSETSYYNTVLTFKNLSPNKILIENLFEKTAYLSVDFLSSSVFPNETKSVPIRFHPQKTGFYRTDVLFNVGGIKHFIPVTGQCVDLKLELCNPKDKIICFDEVQVGTFKKHRVGILNKTLAQIDVHFDFFDNLLVRKRIKETLDDGEIMKMPIIPPSPEEVKKGKLNKTETKPNKKQIKSDTKSDKGNIKKDDKKQIEENLITEALSLKKQEERQRFLNCFMIVPNMFISLPPRGRGYFDIVFQPNQKMEFKEKIYFETQDHTEVVCMIKGSSTIMEFSLDKKEVLFMGVIKGCSSSQLVTLKNTGDIIGSFKWQMEDKRNLFNIEPKQGFILPKNNIEIKITFAPQKEKCEFKVKAKCVIRESKESLLLMLKGNSVNMPEPKGTVTFKCNVREEAVSYTLTINNGTSEKWELQPAISNDVFYVAPKICCPPFTSCPIAITYAPKRMTLSKPDEGTIFIQLPSDGALLYNLIGTAGPPALKKRIDKEITCKQNWYEMIPIENWLTIKQTFDVVTEVISPIGPKTIFRVLGFKTIELMGRERKNYKWGVYVVNEGAIEFRVTFKNVESGEYEFFEINLKVLPSQPIETINFDTPAREAQTKTLQLENPVDVPVIFTLECAEKNVVLPKTINIQPYTKIKVDITYTPLQTETTSTSVNVKCEQLGTYTYLVQLRARPPKIEDCLVFKAELGAKTTKTISFQNTFEKTIEFTYKFEDQEFAMERCNPISVGEWSKIVISYEPSRLGNLSSKLLLSSAIAGEYIYSLEGEGNPPTPKGPFTVRPNTGVNIEFKNPFTEDKQFSFEISPNFFVYDFHSDIMKARRSVRFGISAESFEECPALITGKLRIFCPEVPEIEWIYYLQCIHPSSQ